RRADRAAGLDDPARPGARAGAARRARDDRARGADAREPRADLRRAVLAARPARARRVGHAARRRLPDRAAPGAVGLGPRHAAAGAARARGRAARLRRGLRLRLLRPLRAAGAGAAGGDRIPVLMYGDTERNADLFHIIPQAIVDPFLYLENG